MLLADSDFRISIEKSLQPFSGLLIGLAFISLGMSLQFADMLTQPVLIIAGTLSLILIKFAITLGLARYYQHSWRNSTLLPPVWHKVVSSLFWHSSLRFRSRSLLNPALPIDVDGKFIHATHTGILLVIA